MHESDHQHGLPSTASIGRGSISGGSLAAIALALAAAAAFGRFAWWPEHVARQRLGAYLYDADSAKLSSIQENRKRDVVCGILNAKNRFGAYTGARRFIALASSVEIEPDPPATHEARTEDGAEVTRKRETFQQLHVIYCTPGAS